MNFSLILKGHHIPANAFVDINELDLLDADLDAVNENVSLLFHFF